MAKRQRTQEPGGTGPGGADAADAALAPSQEPPHVAWSHVEEAAALSRRTSAFVVPFLRNALSSRHEDVRAVVHLDYLDCQRVSASSGLTCHEVLLLLGEGRFLLLHVSAHAYYSHRGSVQEEDHVVTVAASRGVPLTIDAVSAHSEDSVSPRDSPSVTPLTRSAPLPSLSHVEAALDAVPAQPAHQHSWPLCSTVLEHVKQYCQMLWAQWDPENALPTRASTQEAMQEPRKEEAKEASSAGAGAEANATNEKTKAEWLQRLQQHPEAICSAPMPYYGCLWYWWRYMLRCLHGITGVPLLRGLQEGWWTWREVEALLAVFCMQTHRSMLEEVPEPLRSPGLVAIELTKWHRCGRYAFHASVTRHLPTWMREALREAVPAEASVPAAGPGDEAWTAMDSRAGAVPPARGSLLRRTWTEALATLVQEVGDADTLAEVHPSWYEPPLLDCMLRAPLQAHALTAIPATMLTPAMCRTAVSASATAFPLCPAHIRNDPAFQHYAVHRHRQLLAHLTPEQRAGLAAKDAELRRALALREPLVHAMRLRELLQQRVGPWTEAAPPAALAEELLHWPLAKGDSATEVEATVLRVAQDAWLLGEACGWIAQARTVGGWVVTLFVSTRDDCAETGLWGETVSEGDRIVAVHAPLEPVPAATTGGGKGGGAGAGAGADGNGTGNGTGNGKNNGNQDGNAGVDEELGGLPASQGNRSDPTVLRDLGRLVLVASNAGMWPLLLGVSRDGARAVSWELECDDLVGGELSGSMPTTAAQCVAQAAALVASVRRDLEEEAYPPRHRLLTSWVD